MIDERERDNRCVCVREREREREKIRKSMKALVLEAAGVKAASSFFQASSSSAAVAIGPSFDESSPDFFRAARRLFIFRTSKIAF